jgi:hypothetical protein
MSELQKMFPFAYGGDGKLYWARAGADMGNFRDKVRELCGSCGLVGYDLLQPDGIEVEL